MLLIYFHFIWYVEGQKSSICYSTLRMTFTAKPGPGQRQEKETKSGSPTWVAKTQVFEHHQSPPSVTQKEAGLQAEQPGLNQVLKFRTWAFQLPLRLWPLSSAWKTKMEFLVSCSLALAIVARWGVNQWKDNLFVSPSCCNLASQIHTWIFYLIQFTWKAELQREERGKRNLYLLVHCPNGDNNRWR